MRSARLAEWILSLVMPPDRAASTVGDLLEECPPRGPLWFWSNVLRTARSHLWRDVIASPVEMLGLASPGWLVLLQGYRLWAWLSASPGLAAAGIGVTAFVAGWVLAWRAKGRELACVFSVAFLSAVFYLLRLLLSTLHLRPAIHPWPNMNQAFAEFCALTVCMTASAILFRHRANKEVLHA